MSDGRPKLAVLAWLPALLLLSVGASWALTDFVSLSLSLAFLMPPLAAWLGHHYRWRALLPLLLVAPIAIVSTSYRYDELWITLYFGTSVPIYATSLAAALAFATRTDSEPRSPGPVQFLAAPFLAALYFGLSYAGEIQWRAQTDTMQFGVYGDPAVMIAIAAFVAAASGWVSLLGGLLAAALLFAGFTWLDPAQAQSIDSVVVTGTKLSVISHVGWVRDGSLAIWAAAGACAGAALMPFWRSNSARPSADGRTVLLILATLALAFIAPHWSSAGGGGDDNKWGTLPPYLWGESAALLSAAAALTFGLTWPNRALFLMPFLVQAFVVAAIGLYLGREILDAQRIFGALEALVGFSVLAWTYAWIAAAGPQAPRRIG